MTIKNEIKELQEAFNTLLDKQGKKSVRRNADKNIKNLDKEIKKAAKEFDELYMKKQSDPNIDLHPAAHKEGNLRIQRDKEVERRDSVKEAIELMEEEIKKERKNNKQQVYRRIDDPEKGKVGVKKNYSRLIHNDSSSKDPAFDYVKIKGVKYGVDKYGQIGAPLKEAIELMEDLFDTILKQPAEKQGSLVYKYHQAKNKENAGKDTYTQAKEEEKRKSKEEKGQEKTELRKKYRGKSTEDWKQRRLMDQIAKNAANLGKTKDPATAKAIRRHSVKEDLEELQEAFVELFEKKSEKENYKNTGVFHDMNKDIETFYKKADEFIEKMKKNKEGKNLQEQLTSLKEDTKLIEELINEVSKKAAENLWNGRVRNTKNAEKDKNNANRAAAYYGMIQDKDLKHPNTSLELHNNALEASTKLSKAEDKQNKTEARIKSWAKKVKGVDAYPNYNKQGIKFYEELEEQLTSLKEAFDALFEVSGTEEDEKKQNVNKIKREKKVGPEKEPTEIVSVADELFPYEGSAKEQFNQKVIAKINDMIEGKATLEDLIQLVRQKKVAVREGFEGVEDIINIMEEMINELDYNFVSKQKARADKTLDRKEKEEALDDIAKYKHKINTTMDHVDQKRMKEIKAEEAKKNN